MLLKKHRLSKKKEIELIFKTGRSSYDQLLGIKVIKNECGYPRAVAIVSGKVSKKAVIRNEVKRAIFRAIRRQLAGIKPVDMAIIALPPIVQVGAHKIEAALTAHLKKLRLINAS